MIELLASAVDPQLSGSWVLELVMKLFAGFALLIAAAWAAYKKGQANAPTSTETTLKPPVPTVTIKTEPVWASREELAKVQHELKELRTDVDHKLDRLLEGQAERADVARTALGKVHKRLDDNTEDLALVRGELTQVNQNVGRLLDIALKKPGSR